MEKCSTLRDWVEAQALDYLGIRTLLETADYLYCQATALDDRLRLGEHVAEQEVRTFVEQQAKHLIRAGVGEIRPMDSFRVLIEEHRYETIVECFNIYEKERKE